MGNLSLRAIETNEKLDKIINTGFAPGEIFISGSKKNVKFEMKKAKKIYLKNQLDDNFIIKFSQKKILCKVKSIIADEITGNISLIKFHEICEKDITERSIPLVFNNYNFLKLKNKNLKVFLPEISILGKDIPEFININLRDYLFSQKITVKKLKKTLPYMILNNEDETIAIIHEKNSISFAT